jgi:3',5'-cyclic AMP phosphodiesterase CpdA
VAVLVTLLACAQSSLAAPFSFVAMSDSRGDSLSEPINAAVLSAMVAKVLALQPRPAFVLFAGDLVFGQRDCPAGRPLRLAEHLQAWQKAVAPLTGAGIRVYAVPGNHEISGSSAAELQKGCREMLGELQYAFEHEGSRFIALNTDRAGRQQSADLAWLEAQLRAARGAEHIFVFGHEPAHPVSGPGCGLRNSEKFWKLLTRYGVDAYICGHEHLYGRCSRSGVIQVITGGAGAPLHPLGGANGFDAVSGSHHLTLWRIDGPRVEVQALAYKTGLQPAAYKTDGTGTWRRIDSFYYLKPRPALAPLPATTSGSPPQ